MGNRGSKSNTQKGICKRATSRRFFNINSFLYYKVYSERQRNLVFIKNSIPIVNNTKLFSTLNSNNKLDPNYVTGFSDGEGCFYIGISPDNKCSSGFRIKLSFQIGLHEKDKELLNLIKSYFGVGKVSKLAADSVLYRVSSIEELKVIIDHFDRYPLITQKYKDYLLFKQAFELIKNKEHLSIEGLRKILSIKSSINLKLSSSLMNAFPDIVAAIIPKMEERKILNYNWLAGFTDAEGCFFVAHKKSQASKLGETVWLKFILTQHSRDENLLRNLIEIFECGRFITKNTKEYGEFVVEKYSDIRDKIIPFFEKYPLYGIKKENYLDFKKVSELMKNKAQLTLEGLEKIKQIKSGMNKNRK